MSLIFNDVEDVAFFLYLRNKTFITLSNLFNFSFEIPSSIESMEKRLGIAQQV